METNKSFNPTQNISGKNTSSGKERLSFFKQRFSNRFTSLTDVFKSYYQRGGLFLQIKSTEDGIDTMAFTSDKNYVHSQLLPDTVWTITHDLNKYPEIIILDSNERKIEGEIKYIDLNNLMINFEEALIGKVICN